MTQPDHAPIGELRGQAYVELLEPLWSYLAVSEEPVPGEVIFTFRLRPSTGRDHLLPASGPDARFRRGHTAGLRRPPGGRAERLERYPRLGYIAPEPRPVPRRVTRAAAEVHRLLGTVGVGRVLRVGGVAAGLGQLAPVPAR